MSNRIVVYTCITGNYDVLRPIAKKCSGIDYICFTDNPNIRSNDWRILPIPADLRSLNQIKQQRLVKILPNKYLGQYDISIWFDANIQINCNLIADFLSEIPLSSNFIFVKPHPTRTCAYEEAKAVIRMGKDNSDVVSRQMANYYNEGYPTENGLVESNILIRKHNDINCIRLMYTWATEVVKGSFRDQLSFNYACWKNGIQYGIIPSSQYKTSDNRFNIFDHGVNCNELKIDTNDIITEVIQDELPTLTVVITTHNRTNVACETIRSLVKNLHYNGKLNWCIADDMSTDFHILELRNLFKSLDIYDVNICRTTADKCGLGASMNNGLQCAFQTSDVVLTTEDDWILEKPFDISEFVDIIIHDQTISGIRLAAACLQGNNIKLEQSEYDTLNRLSTIDTSKYTWAFNNQVMLRHKRIYDKLGYYLVNVTADKSEIDMNNRYMSLTKKCTSNSNRLLILRQLAKNTLDDPSLFFIHAGKSTQGHERYFVPKRYEWIYNDVFFRIIIPSYNVEKYIDRCIQSIATQTFKSFRVIIVDDCSTDNTMKKILSLQKKYDFITAIKAPIKVYAGGCRNIALDFYGNAKYTLFIDADDMYASNNALQNLHDALIAADFPDLLRYSYQIKYKFHTKSCIQKCLTLSDLQDVNNVAPWISAIKSNLAVPFMAYRKRANDVVWFAKQIDKIESVSSISDIIITYTTENPLSGWNSKQQQTDEKTLASDYYVIADLMMLDLATEHANTFKKKQIEKFKGLIK